MKRECRELEAALASGDAEARRAAEAHLGACAECAALVADWVAISKAAAGLRRTDDPEPLWPRIRAALEAEAAVPSARESWLTASPLRFALAAGLALALAGAAALFVVERLEPPRAAEQRRQEQRRLLTEQALAELEQAEAAYVASIEALAELAEPAPLAKASPLLVSYRERLLLLDAAIAELAAEARRNRFNAHLRQELLGLYREKERTLRAIVEERRS